MKKIITLFFLSIFLTPTTHAYLPPSFFLIQKITAEKDPIHRAIVKISIFKPAESAKFSEQLLHETQIFYPGEGKSWPSLALFLESNEEFMTAAWKQFGIPVKTEAELVRYKKEQYEPMKEIPSPFYKQDKTVSLRRFKNGVAFVSADPQNKEKSIWIDKDTFLPLSIQGNCPENLDSLASTRGTDGNLCELHFDRSLFSKNPSARLGKVLLKKSNKTLLIFKVEKILVNPNDDLWNSFQKKDQESGNSDAKSLLSYFFS